MRVWYQSFVDPREQSPYMERLKKHLAMVADSEFSFDVHGISPPDRHFYGLEGRIVGVRSVDTNVDDYMRAFDDPQAEELVRLDHPEGDSPEHFAARMREIHEEFGLRILGGCCGTDDRHVRALATRMADVDGH